MLLIVDSTLLIDNMLLADSKLSVYFVDTMFLIDML